MFCCDEGDIIKGDGSTQLCVSDISLNNRANRNNDAKFQMNDSVFCNNSVMF